MWDHHRVRSRWTQDRSDRDPLGHPTAPLDELNDQLSYVMAAAQELRRAIEGEEPHQDLKTRVAGLLTALDQLQAQVHQLKAGS